MLRRKNWMILTICFIIMMLPGVAWADAVSGDNLVTYVGSGTETEKILPQEKDGAYYLFLPSHVDYTNLQLAVAEGKTLKGTVEGKSLSSSDINGQNVDLTILFGAMEAGKAWELQVFDGEVLIQKIHVMKSANLPSIHITLEGKDLSYIHKNKNNSTNGQFLYRNGADEIALALSKFKGRGNTSWKNSKEKKPYNIKLEDKVELIAGAGKAKDWCLLSNNVYDKTGINNYLAYNLYEMIGGAAALKSQTVDLYVNNQYRGTYFLTEKVELKETRVNIKETEYAVEDEKNKTLVTKGEIEELQAVGYKNRIVTEGKRLTWVKAPVDDPVLNAGLQAYQYATNAEVAVPGGFLLEIDANFYQETSWFITKRGTTIVIKEPEYASKEQLQQIALYVQDFEDALYAESGYNGKGKHYSEYIHMNSFVKRFAVDTVTNNHDIMDKSCYFYIDVESNGKFGKQVLYAGPAWDYDRCNLDQNLFFMYKQYAEPTPLYDGRQDWAKQFIRRGDFMQSFTNFSNGTLNHQWRALADSLTGVIDSITASQMMNQILWDNHFAEGADKIRTDFTTGRYRFWYDTMFNGAEKLLGVSASYDENGHTLHANISGTAAGIQWYSVGGNGEMTAIADATGNDYLLPSDVKTGRFCVQVTGMNPANGCYTDSTTISMVSNVVKVGKSISFKVDNELLPNGEYLVETGGSFEKGLWPAVPAREGYIGTWNVKALDKIEKNTVVKAVYTPIKYYIVYDGNGARVGEMKKKTHTYDIAFSLDNNVYKRGGYWYRGWNTKADGSGDQYKNKAEVQNLTAENKETVVLYAQWAVRTYNLSYKGLKEAENLNPQTYTVKDQIVLKPLKHKEYYFTGWTWEGQDKPKKKAVIKKGTFGDITFKANWKELPKPTKVKATLSTKVGGYDDIKLTWKKTKGAAGYHIYYKKADEKEYIFAKAVKGTSFAKKNLLDSTRYKFKIVPYFKAAGKKYLSTTGRVVSVTTLGKVTDVKVVKKGKRVKVSWTNTDGETGYQISMSTKKKGTQKTPFEYKTTKGKTKTLEAEKGKVFYYKVRAYRTVAGKKVCGPWSDVVSFVRK